MTAKLYSVLLLTLASSNLWAHDPMHHMVKDDVPADVPAQTVPAASGKKEIPPLEEERWWGGSLSTGWQSRMMHYGVVETGNSGAYTTSLSAWIKGFTFNVWSGVGTGNAYQEWDFSVAYRQEIGPVFLIPGYNFRYQPGQVEQGHAHGEEAHEGESHHAEGDEHHEEEESAEGGHPHLINNNEIFLIGGLNNIPHVTPSVGIISNLNNLPGVFIECRLDGDVPAYKDIVTLHPYALLGISAGYNSAESYGWNNFQIGLEGKWKVSPVVSVVAGINYSLALTVLDDIDQGNEVWANVGVSLTY